MIIGLLYIEIFLPVSASLKDKRKVVKSLKDRIRQKFNVSIAEVDFMDKWQRAGIAIVTTAESRKFVDEVLNKVFRYLDVDPGFELTQYKFDYR